MNRFDLQARGMTLNLALGSRRLFGETGRRPATLAEQLFHDLSFLRQTDGPAFRCAI